MDDQDTATPSAVLALAVLAALYCVLDGHVMGFAIASLVGVLAFGELRATSEFNDYE